MEVAERARCQWVGSLGGAAVAQGVDGEREIPFIRDFFMVSREHDALFMEMENESMKSRRLATGAVRASVRESLPARTRRTVATIRWLYTRSSECIRTPPFMRQCERTLRGGSWPRTQ